MGAGMTRSKNKPAARRPKGKPAGAPDRGRGRSAGPAARRRAAAVLPAAQDPAAIPPAGAGGDSESMAAPAVHDAAAEPITGPLRLEASLSIREVGERVLQLKAWLAAGRSELDVSELETIDTAGLQLLLAVAAAAQRDGARLRLIGGQRLLKGAASALGLAEPLAAAAEMLP